MPKIITTFSFNDDYKKYCKLLCKSIKDTYSNVSVFARCVNVDESDISNFKVIFPEFEFVIDNPKLNKEKNIQKKEVPENTNKSPIYNKEMRKFLTNVKSVDVTKYSEEAVYTCHSRFLNLITLLKRELDGTIVLCIDVDTIFKQKINDQLVNEMKDYDLMIYEDVNGDYNEEGCFVVKNGPEIRNFIDSIYKIVSDNCNDWDIDGKAFKLILKNTHLKVKQLDITKYKDKKLTDESILWSGDSHVKNNLKFKSNL